MCTLPAVPIVVSVACRALQAIVTVEMSAVLEMSAVHVAVSGLHKAEPTLGANKLHAKLKLLRPELQASASEVRMALRSLKKEAKAEAEAVKEKLQELRDALLGAGASGSSLQ